MAASVDDIALLSSNILDIFLCRPETNCRLCFIQVDDVIELGLKTWLHLNVAGWTPEDPSRSRPGRPYYKSFATVVSEVRSTTGLSTGVPPILTRAENRRSQRNSFFHDHNQAGLTIENRRCIEAIIDMLDLFENLFPDFKDKICRYTQEQAQYKLMRLRGYALNNAGILELLRQHFRDAQRSHPPHPSVSLRGNRIVSFGNHSPSYEWLASLQDSNQVCDACDEIARQVGVTL